MHGIRWQQRFANYQKALAQLTKFVQKAQTDGLNDLEVQGLIQAFEYTHELAWNVLKDFLETQGIAELYGSKNTLKAAFRGGLIADGDAWAKTINDRNLTVHTYNEDTANDILQSILHTYFKLFTDLNDKMNTLTHL